MAVAGRLMVMTNSDAQIQGNCEATGYEKQLVLEGGVSLSAAMTMSGSEQTAQVSQAGISINVATGPWVAELEQAMYSGKVLGDVTITELAQVTDNAQNKTWKKVRELKLTAAWVQSFQSSMHGIHSDCNLTLEYTDLTYTWSDKVAHFNRSQKTT